MYGCNMNTKKRQPMTFDLDRSPKTAAETNTLQKAVESKTIEKQQVGARITTSKYRQLKAQAALKGVSVQALVEQAIDQFLAKTSKEE